MMRSCVGTGTNVAVVESDAVPPGVRAMTRSDVREAGARSTPLPFTRATLVSLVVHEM